MVKELNVRTIVAALVCAPLVAGICLGAAPAKKTATTRPARPKLACRLANYGPYQEGALAHLQSIGVKYVFMNIPKPEEVKAIRQRLKDHGLKALVVRGDVDWTKPSAPEDLVPQLETCKKMGVKYMFLSVKGDWPDERKQVIYERLRKAGDAAAKYGVTLTIETHPQLGTNADVHLATMKGVNHPNVRDHFDTGNITYYKKYRDALGELKKIIDYVATIEIKDHNEEFETWNFPALGTGKVKIPEIVQVLKDHGYTGPITIEIEGVKGVKRDEPTIKKEIADSVVYLRRLLKGS